MDYHQNFADHTYFQFLYGTIIEKLCCKKRSFKSKLFEKAKTIFLEEMDIIEILQKEYPLIPVYEIDIPGYVKTSAAFLIDKIAGMKGVRVGDVGTYENQALVLVNYGSVTGEEVFDFAQKIQSEVKAKTGIDLEMEVQTLGF